MTTNTVVSNAISSRKESSKLRVCNGVLDYSKYQPKSKYDVLDDLVAVTDRKDLELLKPYAQKFGVMSDWEKLKKDLGF